MHGVFFEQPIEQYFLGHQFSEVYKDKIYEPLLKGKKNQIIVDIGANIGITTYYFAQFAKKVHSIEPTLAHFECLTHMIQYNELKNVEAHKLAIYIKEGTLPFYHNQNATMNSLHTAVNDNTSQPEAVRCLPLDKFFEENKTEHCDLLKMDVEGSEIEIISSPGFQNVADKIETVVCEYHEWSGRPVSQLAEAFEISGFKIQQIPHDANLFVATKQ